MRMNTTDITTQLATPALWDDVQHALTGGGDGGSIAYGIPGASLLALVVLPLAYALTPDAPAALGDALGPLIIGLMLASIAIAAIAGGITITNTRKGQPSASRSASSSRPPPTASTPTPTPQPGPASPRSSQAQPGTSTPADAGAENVATPND